MIEVKGKHNSAKIFTNNVEETAQGQIIELCNQPEYKDSQIRIMPDTHAGAGRIMSRSKAKKNLKLEDFQNTMTDVWTTSVGESTLDEAPMVYKPLEEIIENVQDAVEIKQVIKPLYNFKAN